MMTSSDRQLDLFDLPPGAGENVALWTPRDIWVRLTQRIMSQLGEDRRIDYKSVEYPRAERIDFNDIAKYYSAYSNTPDGGVLVFGATSDGTARGCSSVPLAQLNRLERIHLTLCPQSRPEFRRFNIVIGDNSDFCIAVYIPYVGRLVETNKDEAWIRYGDSIHRMSDDEKRDFRATRQELVH
jgi:ATP-dependent DNA helicase RecG